MLVCLSEARTELPLAHLFHLGTRIESRVLVSLYERRIEGRMLVLLYEQRIEGCKLVCSTWERVSRAVG